MVKLLCCSVTFDNFSRSEVNMDDISTGNYLCQNPQNSNYIRQCKLASGFWYRLVKFLCTVGGQKYFIICWFLIKVGVYTGRLYLKKNFVEGGSMENLVETWQSKISLRATFMHNKNDALPRHKFHLNAEHPAWKSHGRHGGIGSPLQVGGKLNSSCTDGCCLSEELKNQNKDWVYL